MPIRSATPRTKACRAVITSPIQLEARRTLVRRALINHKLKAPGRAMPAAYDAPAVPVQAPAWPPSAQVVYASGPAQLSGQRSTAHHRQMKRRRTTHSRLASRRWSHHHRWCQSHRTCSRRSATCHCRSVSHCKSLDNTRAHTSHSARTSLRRQSRWRTPRMSTAYRSPRRCMSRTQLGTSHRQWHTLRPRRTWLIHCRKLFRRTSLPHGT